MLAAHYPCDAVRGMASGVCALVIGCTFAQMALVGTIVSSQRYTLTTSPAPLTTRIVWRKADLGNQ